MKFLFLRSAFVLLIVALAQPSFAQAKRALFLGNSYTAYNTLANLTVDVSESAGFELEVGSNTPGGYTLEGHSTNAASLALIAEGNWDFVVLQEQSQRPSFPYAQVQQDVFPYATALNDLILASNECTETVFYMTWGRENGDDGNCANWPPVCTYEGMDDLLRERYLEMGEMNDAIVSPVGAVWRHLRENNPDVQLYTNDGSHPSPGGSYAAACAFFAVLFRENPTLITFDFNLDAALAETIRNAVKTVVYDEFETWFVGTYDLSADFDVNQVGELTFDFTSLDDSGVSHFWDFGNSTSTDENPTVTFPAEAEYNVTHTIYGLCDTVTVSLPFVALPNSIQQQGKEPQLAVFPNPASSNIEFNRPLSNARLEIWNMNGQLIKSVQNFNGTDLNVSELAQGSYLLHVKITNSYRVEKLILQVIRP
jgi:hypothetical protein